MSNRNKILDAALRVYAREGFRGATTRLIAQEAGVNEVTLFRQFGSKPALIEASIIYHMEQMVVAPLPEEPVDPQRELTAWCSERLANLRASRGLIRKFMCELQQYPEMLARVKLSPAFMQDNLGEYLDRLRKRRMADKDFNKEAAVQMLRGALFGDAMGRDVHPGIFPEPAEKAAVHYTKLFLRAIGARGAVEQAAVPDDGARSEGSSPHEAKTSTKRPHTRSRTSR